MPWNFRRTEDQENISSLDIQPDGWADVAEAEDGVRLAQRGGERRAGAGGAPRRGGGARQVHAPREGEDLGARSGAL